MAGSRIVVQRFRDGRFEFLQMRVPCGKPNCSKCPHGPYWYAVYWIGRRKREVYVGKEIGGWMEKRGVALLARIGTMREKEDLLGEDGVTKSDEQKDR